MRRSGGLGSVLPVGAVSAAYLDLSPRIAPMTSGTVPRLAVVVDRTSFVSCTTYDELGRLRHAWTGAAGCTDSVTAVGSQPGGFNSSWTYTDDGNIATRRDGATTSTYGYADAAHPHAVTGASGSTFAYTAGGNQRSRTAGSTTTTLTWDVLSRLTTAVTAVGGTTTNTQSYVEAVDGTRLERTVGATTTRYLPGQEIDYTSGVVSGARRYYTIAGTTVAVRVVTPATAAAGGVLTWQVSDRQGSATLQVTDRTGVVARAYTDPYGAPRPSATALVTDRGWLQKTKDTTGLVDLGARYYDPVLGRFLSPDPLNVQVTAQSANAYAYSNNNPVTYTDPTGLEPRFIEGQWHDQGVNLTEQATSRANAEANAREDRRLQNQSRAQALWNHYKAVYDQGGSCGFGSCSQDNRIAWAMFSNNRGPSLFAVAAEITGVQNGIDCVNGSGFDCAEAALDAFLAFTGGWIAKKAVTGALGLVRGATEATEVVETVEAAKTAAELPTLEIDAARMPNIARNVQSALDEGHPGILNRTTDDALIGSNRAAACKGFCGPGSPDEYPFASTVQWGAGARVAGVPLSEQRIQGGVLSQFYRKNGIGDGDPFRVIVTGGWASEPLGPRVQCGAALWASRGS